MSSPCPTNLTLASDITTDTKVAKSTISSIRSSIEAEFTRRDATGALAGHYQWPGWNEGYMWGGPWMGGYPGTTGPCTYHVAGVSIPTCNDLTISDPISTKEINELWSGFRGARIYNEWGLYCPTDNASEGNSGFAPDYPSNIGGDYGDGSSGSNEGAGGGAVISRGVTQAEASADPGYTGSFPDHWGIRRLIEELDEFKVACICDCDYCTCDCNNCTCDCAYCTCDCNACGNDNANASPPAWGYCQFHYMWKNRTYWSGPTYYCGDFSVEDNTITSIAPACSCDCNYCTCDCAYCTCDCNYCTCNCNFCTCNCNMGK